MASLVGETKVTEEIITTGSMVYVFTELNQLVLYEGDCVDKKSPLPKGYTSLFEDEIPDNPLAGMTGGEDALKWGGKENIKTKEEVDEAKYSF